MILNRQDTKNIKILDSKRERTEVVHMQYNVVWLFFLADGIHAVPTKPL